MYDDIKVVDFDTAMRSFEKMPNGYGYSFETAVHEQHQGEDAVRLGIIRIDMEWMAETNADTSLFHVVWMLPRLELSDYLMHVEHKYFKPMTTDNDNFRYQMFKWQDIPWIVITIPLSRAPDAFTAAQELGLRLADGVPRVIQHARAGEAIGGKGHANIRRMPDSFMGVDTSNLCIDSFPLDSDRVYTLEPQHKTKGPHVAGIGIIKPAPADFDPPEDPVIAAILKKYRPRKRRK